MFLLQLLIAFQLISADEAHNYSHQDVIDIFTPALEHPQTDTLHVDDAK